MNVLQSILETLAMKPKRGIGAGGPPLLRGGRFGLRGGRLIGATIITATLLSGGDLRGEEALDHINPHDYGNEQYCASCHTTVDPPVLNFDPVSSCTRCHERNVANHPVTRHPLNKVPRMQIPPLWPLTEDGGIVCYTCHDYHNKSRFRSMLRIDYSKVCVSCHKGY